MRVFHENEFEKEFYLYFGKGKIKIPEDVQNIYFYLKKTESIEQVIA